MTKSIKPLENPFIYGKVVTGKFFVDRERERGELALEIEQHTNIILYSPRRFGKTSLVQQVFLDLKKKNKKFAGLYVDFYTIASREKFLKKLVEEYGKHSGFTLEKLIRQLKKTLTGVVPVISLDSLGQPRLEIQFTAAHTDLIFEQVVNLPQELARQGKLVAVFFDEFQEINFLNGSRFQKDLRSVIQHHDGVSYIFSGSKHHLFEVLFEKPEEPLYRIGRRMELRKIPEEQYLPFLSHHLKKVNSKFVIDHARRIYSIANGIPYYVQMLAHEVFNLSLLREDSDPDTLLELATIRILENKQDEFAFVLEHLNRSERLVLDILVHNGGENLFKKEILTNYGLASSTLRKALQTLQKKGILFRAGKEYFFQDVFFERWLKRVL